MEDEEFNMKLVQPFREGAATRTGEERGGCNGCFEWKRMLVERGFYKENFRGFNLFVCLLMFLLDKCWSSEPLQTYS